MMTAGLRVLSKRRRVRVKLIVDRKFFDLFRNNLHVEVIDIDGPPVDVIFDHVETNLSADPKSPRRSGFLHAAGTFDVPVIAILGPTDGKLFTRRHRRAADFDQGKLPLRAVLAQ